MYQFAGQPVQKWHYLYDLDAVCLQAKFRVPSNLKYKCSVRVFQNRYVVFVWRRKVHWHYFNLAIIFEGKLLLAERSTLLIAVTRKFLDKAFFDSKKKIIQDLYSKSRSWSMLLNNFNVVPCSTTCPMNPCFHSGGGTNHKQTSYNEEDGSVRMYLRGRPVVMYKPSSLEPYDISVPSQVPDNKLKLEWV